MAGESGKPHGESDVVFVIEETAQVLLPEVNVRVQVIEAADGGGPDTMKVYPATVDKALCAHCLACIKLCPSLTWDVEKARVIVNEVSCKGCGICGSVCPTGAISQRQFSEGMILDALGRLWDGESHGREILSCGSCPVEPLAAAMTRKIDVSGLPVRLLCSGRAEPIHVLETLQLGVHDILMIDCFCDVKEKDRFEKGKKRLENGQKLLMTLGSGEIRIETVKATSEDLGGLNHVLAKFTAPHGGGKE